MWTTHQQAWSSRNSRNRRGTERSPIRPEWRRLPTKSATMKWSNGWRCVDVISRCRNSYPCKPQRDFSVFSPWQNAITLIMLYATVCQTNSQTWYTENYGLIWVWLILLLFFSIEVSTFSSSSILLRLGQMGWSQHKTWKQVVSAFVLIWFPFVLCINSWGKYLPQLLNASLRSLAVHWLFLSAVFYMKHRC